MGSDLPFPRQDFMVWELRDLTSVSLLAGVHLGKRLFGLKVIDAKTGRPPSGFQWFRRCLLFSLVVSLNVFFFIPVLVSREQKAFHDMMAGTRVVCIRDQVRVS